MKTYFLLSIFLIFSCQAEESFILINGTTNEITTEFGPNIYERATPACSFNIALSLMGFNEGILQDENTPIWDFQEGYDSSLEPWKAPQSPLTWMGRSCVWYSKIITLGLGLETMQQYLALFEYGNQDLSTGIVPPGPMNPAWVSSSLKISPKEQIDFIQKMVQGKLPISSHALQMTKIILFKEDLPEVGKLYGKGGMGTVFNDNEEPVRVRWFVGWVENGANFFPFAYQLQAKEIDPTQTVPRVKYLLSLSEQK